MPDMPLSPDKMKKAQRRYPSLLLSLYLAKKFFLSLLFTTLVISAFVAMMDSLELFRRMSGRDEATLGIMLFMVIAKLPSLMMQIAPFCVLLSSLISFSQLTRNQELIAIRSAGVPARQFLLAPLFMCFMVGVINIFLFNPTAAVLQQGYDKALARVIPSAAKGYLTDGGNIWLKQEEEGRYEMLIYANNVEAQGSLLKDVSVFHFNHTGDFVRRIDAKGMSLNGRRWEMHDVTLLEPDRPMEHLKRLVLPTSLTLDTIRNSFSTPQTLNVFQLPGFIKNLRKVGFPTAEHQLYFYQLLATPILMMAMFLLAVPVALHFSRMRGMGSMILVGLVFGFGFYFFSNLVGAYSLSGQLNLWLGAWAPTGIALILALALFLHYREE